MREVADRSPAGSWQDGGMDAGTVPQPGETRPGETRPGAMPPGETDTDEITALAVRLRLTVGRLSRRVRVDGRESIPPLQLSALVTVEEAGPLRLSDLARREAVTAPTMSRVLAALDEQGLVVRSPDPQDARGVLITVSEHGSARLEEVRSQRTALIARRLARLTPDQITSLTAALPAMEALLVDEQ